MYGKSLLQRLQRELASHYARYREGEISEKEYLQRAKPIDNAIDTLEISTLQDNPALKESLSAHFPKQ